jgi:dTDP-4-dehydrorhamnose 3,5-epimerase
MAPAKQVNLSQSHKAALRGIHFSLAPEGQQKFVTALSGSFYDLVIDLRENSPTFLEFESFHLQGASNECIFIDSGLGHSVLSLENDSKLLYLLSSEYNPDLEKGLNPLDPDLGIDWPITPKLISEKDSTASNLKELKSLGHLPSLRSNAI